MNFAKIARMAAVAAAGAGAILASSLGPAYAGPLPATWDATDTAADVVGAWGWGSIQRGPSYNTLEVTAHVKDTLSDSHGARVYVHVAAPDGKYLKTESISASGAGATDSATWSFDWDPQPFGTKGIVSVKECLTEQGEDYQCGDWTVIFSETS